jgi:hypothetical protein
VGLIPKVFETFVNVFAASNKVGMLLLGVPFGLGLYVAYSLCRLKFPDIETNKSLAGDVMGSFNYQASSAKRWYVWLFAILCGVLNAGLLVAAGAWANGQL